MLFFDIYVLVWFVMDLSKLGKLVRRRVVRGCHVSVITFWELEMLVEVGCIWLGMIVFEVCDVVLCVNVEEVLIDGVIVMMVACLGMYGDLGDRFIVVIVLIYGVILMMVDEKIQLMKFV